MSSDTQNHARSGMLAGGNWIIDQVKIIDVYPKHEQLANIFDQSQGTGGSPYNVLLDLAKMGADFLLQGAGLVGQDALGEYIIEDCLKHKIDPKFISFSPGTSTSYTDVMTEREGGRRTFFHNRGANATWDGSEIDFAASSAKIFHLGYLLLLDAIDQEDPEHGTVGAALLAKARAAGMKTSIDVVSEDSDRFARIIGPALKQVDVCILNEVEGSKVTGVQVRENGKLLHFVNSIEYCHLNLLDRRCLPRVVLTSQVNFFAQINQLKSLKTSTQHIVLVLMNLKVYCYQMLVLKNFYCALYADLLVLISRDTSGFLKLPRHANYVVVNGRQNKNFC